MEEVTPRRAALLEAFDDELGKISKDEKYYWYAAVWARAYSYIFKTAAVVAFAAGSLAPFADDLLPLEEVKILKWGFGCLVVAGLLLGIDQIFISNSTGAGSPKPNSLSG